MAGRIYKWHTQQQQTNEKLARIPLDVVECVALRCARASDADRFLRACGALRRVAGVPRFVGRACAALPDGCDMRAAAERRGWAERQVAECAAGFREHLGAALPQSRRRQRLTDLLAYACRRDMSSVLAAAGPTLCGRSTADALLLVCCCEPPAERCARALLRDHGASPNAGAGVALFRASQNAAMARVLLDAGAEPQLALVPAAHLGNAAAMRAILRMCVDPDTADALVCASSHGHVCVVRALAEHDPVAVSQRGGVALCAAAKFGHEEAMAVLLQHVDAQASGGAALRVASAWGQSGGAGLLLRHGARHPDAIVVACARGHSEVARLLLPHAAPADVGRALCRAAEQGHDELAVWLVRSGGAAVSAEALLAAGPRLIRELASEPIDQSALLAAYVVAASTDRVDAAAELMRVLWGPGRGAPLV